MADLAAGVAARDESPDPFAQAQTRPAASSGPAGLQNATKCYNFSNAAPARGRRKERRRTNVVL
jgi:hypothetical protein